MFNKVIFLSRIYSIKILNTTEQEMKGCCYEQNNHKMLFASMLPINLACSELMSSLTSFVANKDIVI